MSWVYSFGAISVLGLTLPFITIAQVPSGSPRDVAASPTSSRSIRVTWSDVPTDERNGTLQLYQVLYEQSAFSGAPQSSSVEVEAELEDQVMLEDLQEFVEYSVRVRASNEDGYGPFSSPVVATTYQDVPSVPPQNVVLLSHLPHQLLLTWQRPPKIETNGLLLFYSLRYHRVGYDDFVFDTVNASAESSVLSGLCSYATYEAFLAASTVNGTGPFARQTGQTIETAPQSPPQNFTANSSTPNTIDMEWRPPDESEWNGVLRGYQLRYAITNSPEAYHWLTIHISSPNQTTYTLLGLSPSTIYCVQLAAVTVGAGPFTSPLYIETLGGIPSGPDGGSGEPNVTLGGGNGDVDNETVSGGGGEDNSVAVIAGSVLAAVASLIFVGVAFSLAVAVVLRQRRLKKSLNLAGYFTASSEDPHQVLFQQQPPQEEDGPQEGLTFTNPSALSFELQPNSSYNTPLPTLPPPPATSEFPSSTIGTYDEGQPPSLSVRIADNPQYHRFSSDQLQTNSSRDGRGGVIGGVVSEGEYDYPVTFRVAQEAGRDTYSQVRPTSDEEPPYATIT